MISRSTVVLLTGSIGVLGVLGLIGASLPAEAPHSPIDDLMLAGEYQEPLESTPTPTPADANTYYVSGPNGVVVAIEPFGESVYLSASERTVYPRRLRIERNGELMSVFSPQKEGFDYSTFDIATSSVSFSPTGRYVRFHAAGYEGGLVFLIDGMTGLDITPHALCAFDPYWISEDRAVLHSYYCGIDGSGQNGIYLWNAATPHDIETIYESDYGASIERFDMSNDLKKLTFIVEDEEFTYDMETKTMFKK